MYTKWENDFLVNNLDAVQWFASMEVYVKLVMHDLFVNALTDSQARHVLIEDLLLTLSDKFHSLFGEVWLGEVE